MFLAKFANMTDRLFIQVILPLRLEWEPYYYLEAKGEQAQPAVGPAAVAGQDHQPTWPAVGQDNQPDEAVLKVGDRVRVDFAGKEYVGVVSAVDVGRQAEALGIVDRIKPIAGKAEGPSAT